MTANETTEADVRTQLAPLIRGSAIQSDRAERMLGLVLWTGLVIVLLVIST
jgi:hypothetical protein